MIIEIPGREKIEIKYIVFDYNGTIAIDGKVKESIKDKISELSEFYNIYVLTADTYGNAQKECEGLPLTIKCFPSDKASSHKLEIVQELGNENCICYGNGYNDIEMFKSAILSVAVINDEGCSGKLIQCADMVVNSIDDGLDLLLKQKRIVAGLRL
ncbi:MAG: HAD family hydrolase [Lachnospirales bacterium]